MTLVPDGKTRAVSIIGKYRRIARDDTQTKARFPISRLGPAAESVKMLLRAEFENGFEELLEKPGDFSVV